MRFQIDWVIPVVSKFTVSALLYFAFEGNFPRTSFRGLIFGGEIYWRVYCIATLGGFHLEELIHRDAYFLNFFGNRNSNKHSLCNKSNTNT